MLYIVGDMLQAGEGWVRPVHVRKTKMVHSTTQQEVAERFPNSDFLVLMHNAEVREGAAISLRVARATIDHGRGLTYAQLDSLLASLSLRSEGGQCARITKHTVRRADRPS